MSTEKVRIYKKIGREIKKARKRKGLKLRQVALEAKCTPGNLSSIEKGRWGPSGSLAAHLSRLLGLREGFLTSGVEPIYNVGVTNESVGLYGTVVETSLDPKRARLVELVKRLAADKNTEDLVIDALLTNAEAFSLVPKKEEDDDD